MTHISPPGGRDATLRMPDAVRQAIHLAALKFRGGGILKLAEAIGVRSLGVFRNKLNDDTCNQLTVAEWVLIDGLTDCAALHAMAEHHGYILVPSPEATAAFGDRPVVEAITDIWMRIGKVGETVSEAFADNRIEAHEVQAISDAIHRSIVSMKQMLAEIKARQEPAK